MTFKQTVTKVNRLTVTEQMQKVGQEFPVHFCGKVA
jgi:hypothetical protein